MILDILQRLYLLRDNVLYLQRLLCLFNVLFESFNIRQNFNFFTRILCNFVPKLLDLPGLQQMLTHLVDPVLDVQGCFIASILVAHIIFKHLCQLRPLTDLFWILWDNRIEIGLQISVNFFVPLLYQLLKWYSPWYLQRPVIGSFFLNFRKFKIIVVFIFIYIFTNRRSMLWYELVLSERVPLVLRRRMIVILKLLVFHHLVLFFLREVNLVRRNYRNLLPPGDLIFIGRNPQIIIQLFSGLLIGAGLGVRRVLMIKNCLRMLNLHFHVLLLLLFRRSFKLYVHLRNQN